MFFKKGNGLVWRWPMFCLLLLFSYSGIKFEHLYYIWECTNNLKLLNDWKIKVTKMIISGVVDKILSATIFYPFSRVTYCAYLVHPIAIRAMVMSMDSPLHLGSIVTIIIYLGQMVVAFVLSFIVSVVFEAPIVSLLRIIAKFHRK